MFSLTLNTENGDGVFTGGQTVRGKIIWQRLKPPKSDDPPARLRLEFTGRTHTKVVYKSDSHKSTERSRAELFTETSNLFEGPAGDMTEHSQDFAVQFPSTCSRAGTGSDMAKRIAPGHPLPPSMRAGYSSFTAEFSCFVEYKITVTLNHGFRADPAVQEQFLSFFPAAEPLSPFILGSVQNVREPPPATRRIKSPLLDPANQNRQLSFREKTKFAFRRKEVPEHLIRIHISHPSTIMLESPFGCTIRLEHLLDRSTAPELPTVTLRSVTTDVEVVTYAAAENSTGKDYSHDHTRVVLGFTAKPERFFDEARNLEQSEMCPNPLSKVLPTFTTFNIRQSYKLKTEILVLCCDQEFRIEKRTNVTVLVPPDVDAGMLAPAPPPRHTSGSPHSGHLDVASGVVDSVQILSLLGS